MKVPKLNSVVKSILVRIASTDTVKRLLSWRFEGLATVFLLHRAAGIYEGINGHHEWEIEQILIELKRRNYNFVSLHQVVDAARNKCTLPSGSIAFTLDDGYRDQIEVIAPIFVKHDVPLTIFLITGLINGELWPWDAKINWLIKHVRHRQDSLRLEIGHHRLNWPLGSPQDRLNTRRELQTIGAALPGEKLDGFLQKIEAAVGVELPEAPPTEFSPANWDQIRQLEGLGVRFAPHTHTHRILSRLQEAEVRSELGRSLEIIMSETRHGLPVLAYPVGMDQHFGLREMHIAESMGFSAAFAVCKDYDRWGNAQVTSELRFRLARFGLPNSIKDTLWLASGLQAITEGSVNFDEVRSGVEAHAHNSMQQRLSPLKMKFKVLLKRFVGRLQLDLGHYEGMMRINADRIERLVFVCRGNVSRSPYAEAVAKSYGLSAISCGVDVSYSAPAELMAVRAALMRGKDLSLHISRSIFDVQLEATDCLVAMDPSHLPVTLGVAAGVGCQVTLIGLWLKSAVVEIQDPYGKSKHTYHLCYDKIEKALDGLIDCLPLTVKNVSVAEQPSINPGKTEYGLNL